jgi:hypothetical protein
MTDDTPAKIYSDQGEVTIYLGDSGDGFTMPFKEKWRAADGIAGVAGFIITAGWSPPTSTAATPGPSWRWAS